jgi:hypothetical protein
MIQRIQTVFLIIAFAFQLSMIFIPFASVTLQDKNIVEIIASGNRSDSTLNLSSYSVLSLLILIINAFLLLIVIFLYKNRQTQMRLCIVSVFLLLVFQLLLSFIVWNVGKTPDITVHYKIAIFFPLISAILSYLAFRSIKKDEKLIRSIDRIR